MMRALGAAAALLLLLARRILVDRRHRARRRRQHPVGDGGIVPGAEPITWGDGPRVVLLLHGFGDTPQSILPVARALHAAGFAVRAPLLPGHGRTLEDFARSRSPDWRAAARDAYSALAAEGREVAVVGVSMGGALACDVVATQSPPPRAIVLIAPYLYLPPTATVRTALWPLWSLWRPWIPGNRDASIRDPEARARSLGYGVATPRLLRELRAVAERGIAASRTVRVPTLMICSRHDYRIPASAAHAAFDRLGAREKSLRWVERSGHVLTVDFDAAIVAEETTQWIARWFAQRA